MLGTAVGDSESFEFWREFLASLKARGLARVHLVTSDAHAGLKAAVAHQFTNVSWQRCRVHFMRNLHTAVSAKNAPAVTAAVKTIFAHTEPDDVAAQWGAGRGLVGGVVSESRGDDARRQDRCVGVHRVPEGALAEDLVQQSDRAAQQGGQTPRRCRGDFPQPAAFLRLATAVVIEAHDEWQVTRRYLSDVSMDELKEVIAEKTAAAALAKQHQIA